ncbi:MAG: hypothetical protein JWN48_4272 [Myxococcaceae bacterium]|nr:hypothetical protein [Myxococcaceae bacterium]
MSCSVTRLVQMTRAPRHRRAASFFALAALGLCFRSPAAAHGPPPAATALLAVAGEQATLVSLSQGLASRTADGFRFVCPEMWGGNATAPAAGLAKGSAAIAGDKLYLVSPEGRVVAHPDDVGSGIALVSQQDAVVGLFLRDGQHELRRITESTSELVRGLDEPFMALAAGAEGELSLLRWTDSTLVVQQVSSTGELLARTTWSAPSRVAYAELRAAAAQLYVVTWGSAAPWVTLGRVTQQGYEPELEAGSDIDGPLALTDGTVIARDGQLRSLPPGALAAPSNDHITCLGQYAGLAYACAHGDLMRVEPEGLSTPLFELASLQAPDDQGLTDKARQSCSARWIDLRVDVASAARMRAAAVASSVDAGALDASTPDASSAATAALGPQAQREAPELDDARDSGCSLGAGRARDGLLPVILLLLLASLRRRLARSRPPCANIPHVRVVA